MTAPLLYDSHMHTPLCKHARGEPEAYAGMAEQRGLQGIIFTCHNPTENDAWSPHVRMRVDQFDAYLALVDRARLDWQGRVDVRLGLECDYYPGAEDWLTGLLARADFDYVLGSVHPQLPDYKTRYYTDGDEMAFQRLYFEHLAMAAETGLFDCLAHPDLVKTVFPQQWQPDDLADAIDAALDRIAAAGTAMELNTYGLKKPCQEMHPGRKMLAAMEARGIPVVLGSDAHEPARVGDDFAGALTMLRDVGYKQVFVYQGRERQTVAIPQALASLVASS